MFHEPEDLDFAGTVEEMDFAVRVLKAAIPQLTRRQLECAYLLACGLTQEQAGEALGIEHQAVSIHFQKHLDAMANVSKMLR